MTRRNLASLVTAMFGLLAFAFVFVFFRGLVAPTNMSGASGFEKFNDVQAGQTVIRRIAGQRVWLTRLSEQQFQQATSVAAQLVNPASGCDQKLELCALAAATARDGIELSYSASAPPQLPDKAIWFGGFVDPTTGAVFDLLGRAYRLPRESGGQGLKVVEIKN